MRSFKMAVIGLLVLAVLVMPMAANATTLFPAYGTGMEGGFFGSFSAVAYPIMGLMLTHDYLYYGCNGVTAPNPGYVKWVDSVNAAPKGKSISEQHQDEVSAYYKPYR